MQGGTREAELVRRAAGGDAVAPTLLLSTSRVGLQRYVAGMIPADLTSSVDPDDVVQDAHVEVYRHISEFQPLGDDAFGRWVRTIALRKLRDAIKARRTAKRGGDRQQAGTAGFDADASMVALIDMLSGPNRTPSRSAARHEAVGFMKAALDALPDDHRKAIWLVHIEGRPIAEAAAAMGRTDRAVHGLLRRGLENLRERLGSASRFLSSSE